MEKVKRGPNTSLRLPEEVNLLWSDIAESMNLSKTAVFVLALRELAKKEGIRIPDGQKGRAKQDGAE